MFQIRQYLYLVLIIGLVIILSGCRSWQGCEEFSESSAVWLLGELSPNFRHLEWSKTSTSFEFKSTDLKNLISLNSFNIEEGQDEVLFGLRGCQIINDTSIGFVESVALLEVDPDHRSYKDVIGVWKQSTGEIAVSQGSTIPNWQYMCKQVYKGGHTANMLPTGRYIYTVGYHRKVEGAFRQDNEIVVLRSNDDLIYETTDDWEAWTPWDNIHPGGCPGDMFSSAGCQTIPGTFGVSCPDLPTINPEQHAGTWAGFRSHAGLDPDDNHDNWGEKYVYILLTCREAELVSLLPDQSDLTRLRFGSSGDLVFSLQTALNALGYKTGPINGVMGPETTMAYINWQQSQYNGAADGIVTPKEAILLGFSLFD